MTIPESLDLKRMEEILHKKAPWILMKQAELKEIHRPARPKEFVSGEKLPYLGRNYRLKVHRNTRLKTPHFIFKQGRFIAEIPDSYTIDQQREELRKSFMTWAKDHARPKIEQRIQQFAPLLDVQPVGLTLKDQEARWGSCTKSGRILINWKIILSPLPIVDYIVVHELAHLRVPDHSREFWETVRSVLPDFEKRKEWLRVNGPTITI